MPRSRAVPPEGSSAERPAVDALARRVLVVEDDEFVSALLTDLLAGHGFAVRSAPSAARARRELDRFDPDAVVLDVSLGDGPNGVVVAHLIRQEYPGVAIVFLTRFANADDAGFGPDGIPDGCAFLTKARIGEASYVIEALEAALRDRPEEFRHELAGSGPLAALTPNQREVLALVAEGLSNAAIAERRGRSISAVEQTLASIFRTLALPAGPATNQRVQAARLYLRHTSDPGPR